MRPPYFREIFAARQNLEVAERLVFASTFTQFCLSVCVGVRTNEIFEQKSIKKTEIEYHLRESNPRTGDERLRYNQLGQSAEVNNFLWLFIVIF